MHLRRHHRHGHPPSDRRGPSRASAPSVGLHLHQTRGTALVNAYTALELGVTRFDTAVGGLGGSPFAHGAGGNLATEELVALLDDCGVRTGIDVEALIRAAAWWRTWSAGRCRAGSLMPGPAPGGLGSQHPTAVGVKLASWVRWGSPRGVFVVEGAMS